MYLLSTWMTELAEILFGIGPRESTIVWWLGSLFRIGHLSVAAEFEPLCVHHLQTLQFLSSITSKLPSRTFGDYIHVQFLPREQGSLARPEGETCQVLRRVLLCDLSDVSNRQHPTRKCPRGQGFLERFGIFVPEIGNSRILHTLINSSREHARTYPEVTRRPSEKAYKCFNGPLESDKSLVELTHHTFPPTLLNPL